MRPLFMLMFFIASASAQVPDAKPVVSPEVHADRSVTFRFRAPNAKAVFLALEGAQREPMKRDDQGDWSVTTQPLQPDFYGYSFVVDGVRLIDPNNSLMKPNLLNTQSVVHVPGPANLPWEIADVQRGSLHRHFYKSAVVGDHRDFYIYTPAGYEQAARTDYPVLFLLHGFSDDASAWTAVGRANIILDNLIARGKAKPMIVVMPLGYGAPEILKRSGSRDNSLWRRNMERFQDATIGEVLPRVERLYRVSKDRDRRAIAGLSMGGAESLFTGLNSLDYFAWIGAFSSGGLGDDFDTTFPGLDSKVNARLRLLWIACGRDDRLIESNRKFLDWLKSKNVRFTWTETAGAHSWMVWRRYLADFTPLLF